MFWNLCLGGMENWVGAASKYLLEGASVSIRCVVLTLRPIYDRSMQQETDPAFQSHSRPCKGKQWECCAIEPGPNAPVQP